MHASGELSAIFVYAGAGRLKVHVCAREKETGEEFAREERPAGDIMHEEPCKWEGNQLGFAWIGPGQELLARLKAEGWTLVVQACSGWS